MHIFFNKIERICCLIAVIASCSGAENKNEESLDTYFSFHRTDCNSLNLFSFEKTPDTLTWLDNAMSEVKFKSYQIGLFICEGVMERPTKPVFTQYNSGDVPMEQKLKQAYLELDSEYYHNPFPRESLIGNKLMLIYTSERVKSLSVTCRDKLFGIDGGKQLNSFIDVDPMGYWYSTSANLGYWSFDGIILKPDHSYTFFYDSEITLKQYLSWSPILNPALLLGFNSTPQELPLTTSFTVEITLENGKRLVNTTPEISLY